MRRSHPSDPRRGGAHITHRPGRCAAGATRAEPAGPAFQRRAPGTGNGGGGGLPAREEPCPPASPPPECIPARPGHAVRQRKDVIVAPPVQSSIHPTMHSQPQRPSPARRLGAARRRGGRPHAGAAGAHGDGGGGGGGASGRRRALAARRPRRGAEASRDRSRGASARSARSRPYKGAAVAPAPKHCRPLLSPPLAVRAAACCVGATIS
eukprot:scaffold13_cov377-Prasinococcus_capsulatus_cf.AAC.5